MNPETKSIYEALCYVIENLPDGSDPLACIGAAKGLLATLIVSYYDARGKDLTNITVESLLHDIRNLLDDIDDDE